MCFRLKYFCDCRIKKPLESYWLEVYLRFWLLLLTSFAKFKIFLTTSFTSFVLTFHFVRKIQLSLRSSEKIFEINSHFAHSLRSLTSFEEKSLKIFIFNAVLKYFRLRSLRSPLESTFPGGIEPQPIKLEFTIYPSELWSWIGCRPEFIFVSRAPKIFFFLP